MGHFCWMCQRHRPNEAFSGKGHARHLCKECSRLPKESRERRRRLDNLHDMLFRQSRISPKNIWMAMEWAAGDDPEVTVLALIVAEAGRYYPGKRKRLGRIKHDRPALWERMIAADLLFDFDEPLDSGNLRGDEEEWPEESGGSAEPGGTDGPMRFEPENNHGEPYDDDEIPF